MAMSENDVHYDVHAVEKKWLPVWERLDPFRADDAVVTSGGEAEALRADDVPPLPER